MIEEGRISIRLHGHGRSAKMLDGSTGGALVLQRALIVNR